MHPISLVCDVRPDENCTLTRSTTRAYPSLYEAVILHPDTNLAYSNDNSQMDYKRLIANNLIIITYDKQLKVELRWT